MPSLKSLRRSARGLVGEKVRGTTGAGEAQDSGVTIPELNNVRERPRQDSTKRAFLRELITTSKAKLGSHRVPAINDGGSSDDTSSSSSGSGSGRSDRSDHDAEKTTSATVSETSY
ncbi:hypothetical protein RRF57_002555 [Xylaria bambusicola]|uniref:Uncharacterized protein n=1 Tax=Xylaria bambusicola TaxID=326684 RepID=A0AAN7YVQ0_9PEZI